MKLQLTTTLFKFMLSFHLFVLMNNAFAQDEEFRMLPDSETVEVRYNFEIGHLNLFFSRLPENYLDYGITFYNVNKGCSISSQIVSNYFSIDLECKYGILDTFVVFLHCYTFSEFDYLPEMITLNGSTNIIKFGGDCYNLNCVPNNDPWMPTAYQPFLFHKNGYYLNPENGKIKKGARAINSGFYTSCDLKNWIPISPTNFYQDKKGVKHRGSDLIKKRRIKLDDWDLGVF